VDREFRLDLLATLERRGAERDERRDVERLLELVLLRDLAGPTVVLGTWGRKRIRLKSRLWAFQ